jgi:hypothetical protein
MKMRRIVPIVLVLSLVVAAGFAQNEAKKPKPGPLTGTWECTAHGGSQGDLPFTLYLEQSKDSLTGSVSSPMGGTQISAGTVKKDDVEIHIDTPQGNYQLTAKLKKGELSGKWTSDNENGTWEGKKQASSEKQ